MKGGLHLCLSANNLLSPTTQIQKRAQTHLTPRDAHVNRALDPISCHKGSRTAEAVKAGRAGTSLVAMNDPRVIRYQQQ